MMKTIVITGSTRGIGYGLADSFLAQGCAVTISGRGQESVQKVVEQLSGKYASSQVFGQACDVTHIEQVQALWESARDRFGKTDIWINNAGIAHPLAGFWDHPPERIRSIVETNIVGAMFGAKVALRGMLDQGEGFIYNMEGYGSNGRNMVKGMALYGSTKAAIRFLTEQLAQEVEKTPVKVGALRPGMVVTEMITSQYEGRPEEWKRARRIFNIIADRVETVTPWLVQKILENTKNGATLSWSSTGKIFWRFLTAPIARRDLFSQDQDP